MKFLYKLLCRSKHLSYFWHRLWTKKLLKNIKRLQGIAVGLFGYAIGTYFGFTIAQLLLAISS
jgi:hypothetical protein